MEINEKTQLTIAVVACVAIALHSLKVHKNERKKRANIAVVKEQRLQKIATAYALQKNEHLIREATATGNFDEAIEAVKFDMIAARYNN